MDRKKMDLEENVRFVMRFAGVAMVLGVAACSGSDQPVDKSFEKDLELAAASSPITLQETAKAAQVVSRIERTTPQVRRIAPSQRVARHTPAPQGTPAPVEVETAAAAELEPTPVEIAEAPIEEATLPSPRPQPVNPGGTGPRIDVYGGDGVGPVIAVVLRGGRAGIDDCDPRTERRRGRRDRGDRGGYIAINSRIPVVGTFPGSGRLAASIPRTGGRARF